MTVKCEKCGSNCEIARIRIKSTGMSGCGPGFSSNAYYKEVEPKLYCCTNCGSVYTLIKKESLRPPPKQITILPINCPPNKLTKIKPIDVDVHHVQ